MNNCNDSRARFPLSEHIFRTHFMSGTEFTSQRQPGYTPAQLKGAYSYDSAFSGEGIKIAIVAAYDNAGIEEGMRVFCDEFDLPYPEISVYYPQGRAETVTDSWLTESSLDTQWAHAFAPSASLSVVFAKDETVENMLLAAKYASRELACDVVSMSFGTDESAKDKELAVFMSESESIFVASSGDTGGVVSFPSTSPDCISVGGSTLELTQGGRRTDERAWYGTGGGKSNIFEIPEWQGRFYNIYGEASAMRATPDVAMSASTKNGACVFVPSLGGWTTVGGTSLSAACFAGVCALIKQSRPDIETSRDMLFYLYGRAGNVSYSIPQYYFYDITTGMSGNFRASVGWDFASGLGSPVIRQLLL